MQWGQDRGKCDGAVGTRQGQYAVATEQDEARWGLDRVIQGGWRLGRLSVRWTQQSEYVGRTGVGEGAVGCVV